MVLVLFDPKLFCWNISFNIEENHVHILNYILDLFPPFYNDYLSGSIKVMKEFRYSSGPVLTELPAAYVLDLFVAFSNNDKSTICITIFSWLSCPNVFD